MPEDLSFIGFHDETQWDGPLLVAGVIVPWRALGEAAVTMLLGGGIEPPSRVVAVAALDPGETLGPAPQP